MQALKSTVWVLCLGILFITSCNSSVPVTNSNNVLPATTIATSTFTLAPTVEPTFTPTKPSTRAPTITKTPSITPSITPLPANQPALIAIFGETSRTWYSKIAFSPNGLILAQANSNVKLWDVKSRELIHKLDFPYKGEATKILFSPNGDFLAVSISDHVSTGVASTGHLLVWNVITGELTQDWVQEPATMSTYSGFESDSNPTIYTIPVNAMVFLPSSTRLAYANGNKIEIKDVKGEGASIAWSLGDKMYASEMGIRGDSEFLYILMKWYKNMTFPALYRWRFRVEIWHPNTKSFRKEIKFEEIDPDDASKWLVSQYLLQQDDVNYKFDVLDLSTDENKSFPYRIGWKYFNSDASLMLVVRYIGVDSDKEGIEIWTTNNWKNPYTFKPNFIDNWFMLNDVAFSPDKTILALDYSGKISLWNTSLLAQP